MDLSAKAVRRSVKVVKRLQRDNAYFDAMVVESCVLYDDSLVEEARRRAVDGVDEPVIYKGRVAGRWEINGKEVPPGTPSAVFVPVTVRRYSDQLLMFLIKARKPEYRDAARVTNNVLNVDVDPLATMEHYRNIIRQSRRIEVVKNELAEADGGGQGSPLHGDGPQQPVDGGEALPEHQAAPADQ